MRVISTLLLVLMVPVFLGACATGPKYCELGPSVSALTPDTGRIFVYRTSVLGAAIQPKVTLNGEEIGKAVPQGFFYVDRSPGNYVMLTSTEVDRKLSFTLDEGQMRYVRLNISMGFFVGHVYPELIGNEVACEEIQNCKYTGQQ